MRNIRICYQCSCDHIIIISNSHAKRVNISCKLATILYESAEIIIRIQFVKYHPLREVVVHRNHVTDISHPC